MSGRKSKQGSGVLVSKKIAVFVLLMLFVPLGVAYGLHGIAQPFITLPGTSPQPSTQVTNATANCVYQLNAPKPGQKVVCIVFDDGWQSQYDYALPVLKSYGYNASFAIITGLVGTAWGNSEGLTYMTWSEIVSLADKGYDVESHTYSHPNLATLNSSELTYQLAQSKQDLANHGISAPILVYPDGGGAGNATVENLVAKYYVAARGLGSESLNLAQPFDRYCVPAYSLDSPISIEDFISKVNQANNSTIVILCYHKIDYENVDTALTPQEFTAQMQYLKDNNFTVETLKQLFTSP